MKIGLDGLVFQTNLTGVGKYYTGLVKNLVDRFPEAEFVIFTNRPLKYLPDFMQHFPILHDERWFSQTKYILWLKAFSRNFFNKVDIDFYFACNTFMPNLRSGVRKIGILHDLNHLIVPETMSYTNYLAHKFFMRRDCLKIDFLITSCNATKIKAQKLLGVKVDSIINPSIDSIFKARDKSEVASYLKNNSVDYPYLLSVATFEPRKNIEKTINAFLELIQDERFANYKLILAGGKGWKNEAIESLLNANREYIVQLGYVSNEFLAHLYNGASVFLFPSKYEGFGIPVREALQSGCKVLTADIDELKEVGGDDAYYFSLSNQSIYLEKIKQVLDEQEQPAVNYGAVILDDLFKFIERYAHQ